MMMSASRSSSVRASAWNYPEMGWTTGVLGLSSKGWRACYAENYWNEQVLLLQELHGHALQVQQNLCGDSATDWKRTRVRGTTEISQTEKYGRRRSCSMNDYDNGLPALSR